MGSNVIQIFLEKNSRSYRIHVGDKEIIEKVLRF